MDAHRKVVAQAVTEPIMITDDHKEKKGSISPTAPGPIPYPQHSSGQGFFGPGPALDTPDLSQLPYKFGQLTHSSSTPNLPAAGYNIGFESVYQPQSSAGSLPLSLNLPNFPYTHPDIYTTAYAPTFGSSSVPSTSPNTYHQTFNWPHVVASASTPKNSRPASPSGLEDMQRERKRRSIPGRVKDELRMTPVMHGARMNQPLDVFPQ